ncbi:MAG: M1 family metallopeptidase [Saprospiraceae bacterium]|nr:M1 family metallopeptidase [Saprospiraceae bacterium]
MLIIKSEITFIAKLVVLFTLDLFLAYSKVAAQHQRSDYIISCTLNDAEHQLSAGMKITYHNKSGRKLSELKLHTWMNAFKAKKSDYVKQLTLLGDARKYSLNKKDQGGYSKLEFRIHDKKLAYQFENESKEIISLALNTPVENGDSVILYCDYILDIPKNISRGGHLNKSYQMTQWYPKIALLDSTGWNTMNYLEIGEYFNDFGNYEVTISLSSDYKIAATGTKTNKAEYDFLDTLLGNKRDTLHSRHQSSTFNEVHFSAKNVVDFAWFADKEFIVDHDTLLLKSRMIDLWTFYKPRKQNVWKGAIGSSKKALIYLSEKISEYPYPQITLVECDRDARDAMEYPMISLIDKGYNSTPLELEKVIVHEIAHNWFQAIIASNERKDAWLDEGLASFFEKDFFRGQNNTHFLSDAPVSFLTDYDLADDFPWYMQARDDKDLAAHSPLENFSLMGYTQSVYEKPAKGLKLMNKAVGDSVFRDRIHKYYENWKFAHPTSDDFFHHLSIDSVWYKNLYITSDKQVDVKLSWVSGNLLVTHNQPFSIPVELYGYKKGNKVWSSTKYFSLKDTVFIKADVQDYIIADPNFLLPEIKRVNNIARIRSTPFALKKTEYHFVPGIGHSITQDIYLHPLIGFNAHDRFFTGVALHNFTLPAPFTLAGSLLGYSFKTNRPVIETGISHRISIAGNVINSITPEMEYRTFSNGDPTTEIKKEYYHKISPKVSIQFSSKSQLATEKNISFRSIFINEVKKYRNLEKSQSNYAVHEVQYSHINLKHLFPHQWRSTLEFNSSYFNINSSYLIDIPYKYGRKTYGEFRFFAGYQNNEGKAFNSAFSLSGTATGNSLNNDYKYDELILGRSSFNTKLNQQVFSKDAGFYTSSNTGWSDSWLLAATFRSKFSDYIPIRPYFQLALAPDHAKKAVWYFSSGLSFVILRKIIEIHLPVIESNSIKTGYSDYQRDSYKNKCTFLIDLKNLNPMKWLSAFAK